jgi:hypothetical protein
VSDLLYQIQISPQSLSSELQDLPVQGSPLMLDLRVGRWRCGNGRCVRKIFTERVPKLAMPWAQRTNRLHDVVRLIGHGMGATGEEIVGPIGDGG